MIVRGPSASHTLGRGKRAQATGREVRGDQLCYARPVQPREPGPRCQSWRLSTLNLARARRTAFSVNRKQKARVHHLQSSIHRRTFLKPAHAPITPRSLTTHQFGARDVVHSHATHSLSAGVAGIGVDGGARSTRASAPHERAPGLRWPRRGCRTPAAPAARGSAAAGTAAAGTAAQARHAARRAGAGAPAPSRPRS